MINFGKDKAYMEVLYAFRKLIDNEYREGGWLPPVREMSERFNVSTVTYRKATNCLVSESIAESFPGKGIYIIPKQYRPKKIGLVIRDGQESPFVFEENIFIGILKRLHDAGYTCHQIQGSTAANVFRSALTHCVSGLIWVNPSPSSFQVMEDMRKGEQFPFVVISPYLAGNTRDIPPADIPVIESDYSVASDVIADLFKSRGHKKVGCIGWTSWQSENAGLSTAMHKSGIIFKDEYCIKDCIHSPVDISRMIKSEGLTGLIINAPFRCIESVFSELSALPDEYRPEILIYNSKITRDVCRQYPLMKIISIMGNDSSILAVNAVDMLMDNLDKPDNIHSAKVKIFEFRDIKNSVESFTAG